MTLSLAQAFSLFPPSDTITQLIRDLISGNDFAKTSCAEIGKLKVFQLALKLQEIFPDELDSQAMAVAKEILDTIRDLELVEDEAPVAQAPAPQPQAVNVTVTAPQKTWADKNWSETRMSEMLTAIATEPALYPEAKPFIEQQPQVKKASAKSLRWVVPASGATGINVEKTIALLAHLAKDNTVVPRTWEGVRPTSIEAAVGMRSAALYCPFRDTLIEGPDEFGRDLGTISEETHLALIWAKLTGHTAWPTTIDQFETIDGIFSDPLARRYLLIVEDFRAAKLAREDSTEGLSRFKKPSNGVEQMASILEGILNSGKAQPQVTRNLQQTQTPEYYKQLLEESSAGDRKFPQTNVKVQGRIYDSMDVTGTNGEILGAICLGRANVAATNAKGIFYIPKGNGRLVNLSGTNCTADYEEKTYEQLARIAGLI